jgi:hypothetical protein
MRAQALATLLFVLLLAGARSFGQDPEPKQENETARSKAFVYGEWRIQIRPDKTSEYEQLIETKGLPLFREAGGRLVGWWKTLVGDLYEHVTIWEYDDMPAFEEAVAKLGANEKFAEFVKLRDPLLTGEKSRFLYLTEYSLPPSLPEETPFVVHEVHRVPRLNRDVYLAFVRREGLGMLKRRGFDLAGPWLVNVGDYSEVTYLFRYHSLRERDELFAAFASQGESAKYRQAVATLAENVTSRILVPAPFAKAPAEKP